MDGYSRHGHVTGLRKTEKVEKPRRHFLFRLSFRKRRCVSLYKIGHRPRLILRDKEPVAAG